MIDVKAIEFAFAKTADEAAVKGLLTECGLPFEDIAAHLRHFIVARRGARIIGVVGLEALGSVGLLRSVAVKEPYRGKGLGTALYEKMERYAASLGITTLYLLTRRAEGFFKRHGYHTIERARAPEIVRGTKEFGMFCPEAAACMTKQLSKLAAAGGKRRKQTKDAVLRV